MLLLLLLCTIFLMIKLDKFPNCEYLHRFVTKLDVFCTRTIKKSLKHSKITLNQVTLE